MKMSTRGTVIFAEREFLNMGKLSEKELYYEQSIYIHSDMYPSGALPRLVEFLTTQGAKSRAFDSSYLGAWFVGFIVNKQTLGNMEWDYDEPQEDGFKLIDEIRKDLTTAKRKLKKFVEENKEKHIRAYQVRNAMGLDTNKLMKKCRDFNGIGLWMGLNNDCDYTYVIIPKGERFLREVTFKIYIYDSNYEFIELKEVQ